jgi:hypothetical protein
LQFSFFWQVLLHSPLPTPHPIAAENDFNVIIFIIIKTIILWRHDTQHNDTQYNDIEHYNGKRDKMTAFSIMILSHKDTQYNGIRHSNEKLHHVTGCR